VAASTGEESIDRAQVEQTELFGSLDHALEAAGRKHGRQVEQGARQGGDRNALPNRAVVVSQASMVHRERGLCPAAGRRGDVDDARALPEEAPEPSSRCMAENRTRRTGKDRREAAAIGREIGMPYRVDTTVEPMQVTDGSRA
jgi:hypothetical protein